MTNTLTNRMYVAWDYEELASPPYYHIFSLDNEPEGIELDGTIFTISCKQSDRMDDAIENLTGAMEDLIALAVSEMNDGQE